MPARQERVQGTVTRPPVHVPPFGHVSAGLPVPGSGWRRASRLCPKRGESGKGHQVCLLLLTPASSCCSRRCWNSTAIARRLSARRSQSVTRQKLALTVSGPRWPPGGTMHFGLEAEPLKTRSGPDKGPSQSVCLGDQPGVLWAPAWGGGGLPYGPLGTRGPPIGTAQGQTALTGLEEGGTGLFVVQV